MRSALPPFPDSKAHSSSRRPCFHKPDDIGGDVDDDDGGDVSCGNVDDDDGGDDDGDGGESFVFSRFFTFCIQPSPFPIGGNISCRRNTSCGIPSRPQSA